MKKLTSKQLDAMIIDIIASADYDLGKSLDPKCSEMTKSEIASQLAELRAIALQHFRGKS